MNIAEAKNIYCVGIGGIGVSGIARLFAAQGKHVWGSDLKESSITKGLELVGIQVLIGHSVKNLDPKPDLVVYSMDVTPQSAGFVELNEIDRQKIPKLTQAEAVGFLMEGKYGIGVTGTNGKSTTTAMLGLILEAASLDPTVLIGSMLSSANESEKFRANARLGQGQYVVAESDEYHRKMLKNRPQMIIVTNIAEDHLDYYQDLHDIKSAFAEYINSLPADGILIYNADDHNTVEVCRTAQCHKFTYGIHHYADLQAINLHRQDGRQVFDLHLNDEMIGRATLAVVGNFNVANSLAAILAALKLGVDLDEAKKALAGYAGIWRRFEQVGQIGGKPLISDYAHHPAAISATISAAKESYKEKKILVVFQPHHRNRTKSLFGEFVDSLLAADTLIIPEIFDVAGREHGEEISSRHLVDELRSKGEDAYYAKDLAATEELIRQKLPNFDMVLMMGAGDIDLLARKLAEIPKV